MSRPFASVTAALLLALLALPAAAGNAAADTAVADETADPVLLAMELELQRAWTILSEREQPPYFLSLQVIELERASVTGEEGGLQGVSPRRTRWVHADVRVGDPRLDSTHALREQPYDNTSTGGHLLGVGDDAAVLRRPIWLEIDERWRQATERYQRVLTDQQVLVEEEASWDLAPAEPEVSLGPIAHLQDAPIEQWKAAARTASSVFARDDTSHDAYVSIVGEAETRWFVSSEGHKIRTSQRRFRAAVQGDALAEDGTTLAIHRAFDSREPAGLPATPALVATAEEVLQLVVDLKAAPEEEPYRGPAILSGRASAVFFHEIFGHRVEGHRLKQVEDAQTFRNQVGQAILPGFLSVHDDPTLDQLAGVDLRGHYDFDDQGVATERVTLVDGGVLEGFLESRSPVGEAGKSNGHGRREAGNDVVSRQGNLIVDASETMPVEALRKKLIAAAQADGLEYGLYVDDIDGGFTFTGRDIPNAFQIDVQVARRIFVDGRPDELVRGIDLIGTPLQTFGRIAAAGDSAEVFNGTCGAESGWVPVSAASPALLVTQVETQRKSKGQAIQPLYPPPDPAEPKSFSGVEDRFLETLALEAERALNGLRLPEAEPPSWVSLAARARESYVVTADFGDVLNEAGGQSRPGRVEVVVGSRERNSSRISGGALVTLPTSITTPSFIVDDVWAGLARDLWISLDYSYKAALQRYAFKLATLQGPWGKDLAPDLAPAPKTPTVEVDRAAIPSPDSDRLRRLAQVASLRLKGIEGLRVARVSARSEQGRNYLVVTDGTRVVQPAGYAVAYAHADVHRPDGVRLFDRLQWVVRTEADLPSDAVISDAVEQMGRDLQRRASALPVPYYEGPVVFEGEAAADLFRYLAPAQLRGTPPEPDPDGSFARARTTGPRLGRRLLPPGWSVVDDPAATPEGRACGYAVDQEGVPGQRIVLVEDGVVQDLAMSSVPRKDLPTSNGHARGGTQGTWQARLSCWSVAPKRAASDRAFDRKVSALRRSAKLDRVLVVRRMEQGWEGDLPRPTDAVWLFPDGREQPVLSLDFQGVDRRTLRGIVAAAGGMRDRAYLAPGHPGSRAPTTSGLPMVLRAPGRVLVEELEALFPGPDKEPAELEPPPMSAERVNVANASGARHAAGDDDNHDDSHDDNHDGDDDPDDDPDDDDNPDDVPEETP